MILVIDANVMVRMVVGERAHRDARQAIGRGLEFVATLRQLDEAAGVLAGVFKLSPDDVLDQMLQVTDVMTVSDLESYAGYRTEAERRLRWKARDDWHVLATALAFNAGIWSDDRDFFGTGVPVWSSFNIERARVGNSSAEETPA